MVRIINDDLLQEVRERGRCEFCAVAVFGYSQPHHIFTRGAGRLDIRANLIALCYVCHGKFHAGHVGRDEFLLIVAVRDRCLQDDIVDVVYFLRRLDKDASQRRIRAALGELRGGARRLARRELAEAGVLA